MPPDPTSALNPPCTVPQAITVINHLAAELDIRTAMANVRQAAIQMLDCEKVCYCLCFCFQHDHANSVSHLHSCVQVTLFLVFEGRREIRCDADLGRKFPCTM
jgi:hypothetical protein